MVQSLEELLAMEIGTQVQWPEVTGDEVLTLLRITKTKIIFKGEIGIEVPIEKLQNYPWIISFKDKTKKYAPITLGGQGDERKKTAN